MHRLLPNHLKHVTGSRYAPMVFWTLRLCIPLLLSGDFGVRPCMHTATSFLDLRVSSTFSLCGRSSGTSAPTPFLAVLSQLFCHTGLLRELFVFACCWLCSCFIDSRVPIPGCFTFFTAIWRVFHSPNSMISMPTSPSESLLLFSPWNQLNFDVTGFKNSQASRDNRDKSPFSRTTGIVHNSLDVLSLLHLLSRELHHVVSILRSTSSCPSFTK